MKKSVKIKICLGSSCYSRGNDKNLKVIQQHLRTRGVDADLDFRGQLCTERCNKGPILIVNDTVYCEVDEAKVIAIIDQELGLEKAK